MDTNPEALTLWQFSPKAHLWPSSSPFLRSSSLFLGGCGQLSDGWFCLGSLISWPGSSTRCRDDVDCASTYLLRIHARGHAPPPPKCARRQARDPTDRLVFWARRTSGRARAGHHSAGEAAPEGRAEVVRAAQRTTDLVPVADSRRSSQTAPLVDGRAAPPPPAGG